MKRTKQDSPALYPASWRTTLASVPIHNPAAGVLRRERGVVVTLQGKRPAFLVPPLSWVIRPRLQRRMWLDSVGREVWELCDGERTVESIVDAFARNERLTFHEARISVVQYLKELMKRGLVALSVPDGSGEAETAASSERKQTP